LNLKLQAGKLAASDTPKTRWVGCRPTGVAGKGALESQHWFDEARGLAKPGREWFPRALEIRGDGRTFRSLQHLLLSPLSCSRFARCWGSRISTALGRTPTFLMQLSISDKAHAASTVGPQTKGGSKGDVAWTPLCLR